MSRRRALEHLDEDIRDHIERETRDNIDRGMTPDQARAAALRKFGNVARIMEDTRAVWQPLWLEQLLQDARFGARMLRRNPVFTLVVVLIHEAASAVLIGTWIIGRPGRSRDFGTGNEQSPAKPPELNLCVRA